MFFTESIISWYHTNKRDLPWRETRNPYYIWLSEVIMQQTRVEQGLPYYLRFTEQYPTIHDLAQAQEDEVLKLWQGLGYYSRARNMLATAQEIVHLYGGQFPNTYESLVKLKGIGPYTAAALASFAFDQVYPVVDGNVFRVLSRFMGIQTPINSTKAKAEFLAVANELIDKNQPALFNQAIMEFGAMLCKPAAPGCGLCPIRGACYAWKHQTVSDFPVKLPKRKPQDRYLHYFIVSINDTLFIKKRTAKDIWANMYDFPGIETPQSMTASDFMKTQVWFDFWGDSVSPEIDLIYALKHQLTHQTVYIQFYRLNLNKSKQKAWKEHYIELTKQNMIQYAFPKPIAGFLETFWGH